MNKKLSTLYGVMGKPFVPDVPVGALQITRQIEQFGTGDSSAKELSS